MSNPVRLYHMPDWERGVDVTHYWETKIERSLSMKEERHSMADQQRIKMRYTTKTMEALESQQLRAFIRSLNESRLWHPFWPEPMRLVGLHLVGTTELTVHYTDDKDFSRGRLILWRGWVGSEVLTVNNIPDSTTIIVNEPLASTVPDGEDLFVFPAMYGRIEKWQPESETDEMDRWKIDFKEMSEAEIV